MRQTGPVVWPKPFRFKKGFYLKQLGVVYIDQIVERGLSRVTFLRMAGSLRQQVQGCVSKLKD